MGTAFCIVTSRGTYPVLDLIQSIRWSCRQFVYVVVVDKSHTVTLPQGVADQVLQIEHAENVLDGFLAGMAAKWVIDNGPQVDQFAFLSDECLVTQPGLDAWFDGVLARTQVGLLGVLDRSDYRDAYRRCAPIMDHWGMPHSSFTPDGHTLVSPVLFLSREAARTLFYRNLLFPDHCEQWPLSYGVFVSWAVQMGGLYQVGWGHTDKQMPPLFVYCQEQVRCQPAPHILSNAFMLYYSVRQVPGYSEEQLRETYKRIRGEPSQPIEPVRPVVSPQQQGPTTLG
jgi:hypothetical protein